MLPKKILTKDGSYTLMHHTLDANYHSLHGAIQESSLVFIQNGLKYHLQTSGEDLNILEIGFGTGLNFLLTLENLWSHTTFWTYTGIEKYPIDWEIIDELRYTDGLRSEDQLRFMFKEVHIQRQGRLQLPHAMAKYKLVPSDFLAVEYDHGYTLIYYDAFGPGVQENLWTVEMAQKMFDCLVPGGILVTYCVQGGWKRALKAVGFSIEKLPGPPGKREVLRAIKN